MEKNHVNVTFRNSEQDLPERGFVPDLRTRCFTKSPRNATPKDSLHAGLVTPENHSDIFEDSRIVVEKEKHLRSRLTTWLKSFLIREAGDSPPLPREDTTSGRLTWNHDRDSQNVGHGTAIPQNEPPLYQNPPQGFEDVLQTIAKDNGYIQDRIKDLQVSVVQTKEFSGKGRNLAGPDITTDMEVPKCSCGQYWRGKLPDIDQSGAEDAAHWQQRCEDLAEELYKERTLSMACVARIAMFRLQNMFPECRLRALERGQSPRNFRFKISNHKFEP